MTTQQQAVRWTPGPWVAIWGGQYVVPAEHAKRPIGGSEDDTEHRDKFALILVTINKDDRLRRVNVLANAALVAAAPLLYEALEAFGVKADAIVNGTADHLVVRLPLEAIRKAAAALAAARGERPA